jgi:competence protein ComGC
MDESRPLLTLAIVVSCLALLVAIVVPNFVHDPETSPKNTCINNLRLIDAAEQQWALENNKTNSDIPTWTDLSGYIGRSGPVILKCPLGGTYTLVPVSNKPTCSVRGHVLQQIIPDPRCSV